VIDQDDLSAWRVGRARLDWQLIGGWPGFIGALIAKAFIWTFYGICLHLGWRLL
jgi:hypothetical protein